MNREKSKSRFNFIDAIVIVIILVIIGAAVFLIVSDVQKQKKVKAIGNLDFTVRITAVGENSLPLFTEGTIVKDSKNGEILGEIVGVKTEKAKYYSDNAAKVNGSYELVVSEYADKYDVYLTCKATARHDADRDIYTVGNNKILIGAPVYIKIPSFASVAFITDFNAGQVANAA